MFLTVFQTVQKHAAVSRSLCFCTSQHSKSRSHSRCSEHLLWTTLRSGCRRETLPTSNLHTDFRKVIRVLEVFPFPSAAGVQHNEQDYSGEHRKHSESGAHDPSLVAFGMSFSNDFEAALVCWSVHQVLVSVEVASAVGVSMWSIWFWPVDPGVHCRSNVRSASKQSHLQTPVLLIWSLFRSTKDIDKLETVSRQRQRWNAEIHLTIDWKFEIKRHLSLPGDFYLLAHTQCKIANLKRLSVPEEVRSLADWRTIYHSLSVRAVLRTIYHSLSVRAVFWSMRRLQEWSLVASGVKLEE